MCGNYKNLLRLRTKVMSCFLAHARHGVKKAKKELQKEGVFVCRNIAVMLYKDGFILGHTAEGCITFEKKPSNYSPEYKNYFFKSDAESIVEIFQAAELKKNSV